MQALTLNRRALDSLHALRVEPFLKLLSIHPPTFDARSKCFRYVFASPCAIARLMLAGHLLLAVFLRDKLVRSITLDYAGNKVSVYVDVEMPDGSIVQEPATTVASGLDLALVDAFREEIEHGLMLADRYLSGFTKLVYCTPELLLNNTRGGLTYRVRTDVPVIDHHLIDTLDRAMSRSNVQIVAFRVSRQSLSGHKVESLVPAQIVERTQPLRPLAILALGRFIHHQVTPGISMR